jgi:hypothetical protein
MKIYVGGFSLKKKSKNQVSDKHSFQDRFSINFK